MMRATAIESEPSMASSHTRIARSAPLARHLRSASSASCGPTLTTTTSTGQLAVSFIRSASSNEKSSHSFTSRIRKSASTSLPSARISKSSSRAATCLTATSSFICLASPSRRDHSWDGSRCGPLLFQPFTQQLDELPHDELALVARRLQRIFKHGQVLGTTHHVYLQSRDGRGFPHAVVCRFVGTDRVWYPDAPAASPAAK